jgi:mannose/fructose/N-acetylgalactosamine-specific phosphotransferase system component IID
VIPSSGAHQSNRGRRRRFIDGQGQSTRHFAVRTAYNIPHVLIRYYLTFAGYDMGIKVLESARTSGILDKVSEAASIVGLMVVGCMTASYVSFSIPFSFKIAESSMSIQSIFDQIMPGLLPLGLTLFVYYLLSKKNANPVVVLLGIIVFGVAGKLIGLL